MHLYHRSHLILPLNLIFFWTDLRGFRNIGGSGRGREGGKKR